MGITDNFNIIWNLNLMVSYHYGTPPALGYILGVGS